MSDLLHHYKDRNPEETIQIVNQFFKSRNCQIKLLQQSHSEADTYSCTYCIYWHGCRIQQANGKGASVIYAKASCYAELYERFCLFAQTANMNKFLFRNIHQEPIEKELNYIDLLNEDFTTIIFDHLLPIVNKKFINEYIDTFFDGHCAATAYHSLQDNSTIYKNIVTIASYYGSTGFAAGNTLEEAVVQGSCEIFERYIIQRFYSELQEEYYYLNEETAPEYIQHFILSIKESNQDLDVKLYDLSYNFNLPVCLLMINDPVNHTFYFNFGSSPVFEIAAERCFTEMYQGCTLLPSESKIIKRPNDISLQEACLDAYKSAHTHTNIILPENLILKSKMVDNYNFNIFLPSDDYNNKKLLLKVQELDKLNNLEILWTDISLMKDMKAVHIITKDCKINSYSLLFNYLKDLSEKDRLKIFELTKYIMSAFEIAINTPNISEEQVELFINNLQTALNDFDSEDYYHAFDFACITLNLDVYNIFQLARNETIDNYTLFFNLIFQNFNNIALTKNTSLKHLYQNYMLYILYSQENYSNEVINYFFNFLGYRELHEDWKQVNLLYLIKKVFADSLYEIYHSQSYNDFINLFQKDKDV